MSTETQTNETTEIVNKPKTGMALLKDQILTGSMNQIQRHIQEGKLHLPPNYSVENALQSAWLLLQETKDKNQKPVLESCSTVSIINALRYMAIQGLDPARKQCYFIARGGKLCLDRSYFGDEVVAKRLRPEINFFSDVIYEGEQLQIEKQFSPTSGYVTVVKDHKMAFPRKGEIIGAYFGGYDADGNPYPVTIMDIDEIHTSWRKSPTYGRKDSQGNLIPSFHTEQPDQACKRTVIRRGAKHLINTSTDALLMEAIAESELDAIDAESRDMADEFANGEVLTIEEAEAVEITEDSETPQSTEEEVASEAKPW